MAVPVALVHLAIAHATLPGLLPTPPEWKKVPLLPTPPCAAAVILPNQQSPPKPGRADAVVRWDARRNIINKSPFKPGRADAVERWDARKITAQSSSGKNSTDGNSSSSIERWDINKKIATSSSSSSSSSRRNSPASRAASMCQRWDSNKRPVSRGWSSDERWDAHKKPRPTQADNDDGESSTGSNDMEVDDKPQPQPKLMGIYAAPGYLAPPEPRMLPTPPFLALPRFVVA